jgi:glycosyltransferase involved in cell wall biosynthesis
MEDNNFKNNPKISVVMASHNGERFIKESIDSVLGQTYADFEFLIVDDGSTDLTAVILNEYKARDERIKIITNAQCLGLTKSLNIAIKQAKGEFVARMDDDDISLKNRFEKQIDFIQKNPEIILLGGFADLINDKGEIIGEKKLAVSSQEIKKRLLFNNQLIHSLWFARKNILIKEGLYNEKFKKAQDYEFILRLASKYKIANLPETLLKYRVLKTSLSLQNNVQKKFAIKARWLAMTKYGYPKAQGLLQIILRIVCLYIPKKINISRYRQFLIFNF